VVHGAPGVAFWAVYRKGLRDAEKKLGVTVKDLAPEKFSIEKLVDLMNSAVAARPDGIIATITDPSSVQVPLRRAIQSGIPVIAVNTADPRSAPEKIPYLFYVGADNRLAGQRVAERFLRSKTPKRVAVPIHEAGNIGLETRYKGVEDVLSARHIPLDKFEIVGANPTESEATLRGYFTSHPDTDGIVTLGPLAVSPTLKVLGDMRLFGRVTYLTFDLTQGILDAVQSDKILATVGQQQYLQGYLPVELLWFYVRFRFALAADVLTGPVVIDKSNIDKFVEDVKGGYA